MADTLPKDTGRSRTDTTAATERLTPLQRIRSRVVDAGLVVLATVGPFVLGFSTLRLVEHGWQPVFPFHVAVVVMLVVVALIRRRLAYRIRATILLGTLLVVGSVGLAQYGLLGGGVAWLMAFCILSAVAFGLRGGILASVGSVLVLAAIGAGFTSGFLNLAIAPEAYATSATAWSLIGSTFLLLTPLIALSVAIVHRQLSTSLRELQRIQKEQATLLEERARAHRTVEESGKWYRSLFEEANDALFVLRDGVFVECNPATRFLFRCSAEQLIGHRPSEVSPVFQPDGQPSDRLARKRIEQAAAGTPVTFEWRHRRLDGSEFDAEVSLSHLDLAGEDNILAMVRDISVRKRAEAELRRFALVIEQTSEIVLITDTSGTITYVNPAFEEATGYTRQEALGQNPRFLKSGKVDDAVYADLWETIAAGRMWTGQLTNRRKDGTFLVEKTTILPLRSERGNIIAYVGVKRDITREVELERQFLQSQKMEAVGQLAGGVAHDFNNLLQVIQGYGEMTLMDMEEGSELAAGLEQVMGAANRATTLVRQLLAFSRKQVLELETLDLALSVSDLSKMITRVIGEHISLVIVSEPGLKSVRADKGQIDQILMNLCVNARDAMPEGGKLTIETCNVQLDHTFCATNEWARPGRYVVLSVSDTGCGMDEETQARIFEPFFTTKKMGEGTGLGLSTVFGIVRQHDGMIHVYSEVDVGTIFRIYLPWAAGEEDNGVAAEDEPPPGGTETILVADDDDDVRMVATMMLTKAGYQVIAAKDGNEAVTRFQKHADDISLALLDVVMPNCGGREAADEIQALRPDVPVLFASGYSAGAIHTGFVLHEGTKFIQKPYRRGLLLRRVREALDG